MTVECQTITVIIPEADSRFTVPAYTRTMEDLTMTVSRHLGQYVALSSQMRDSVSVGDFALWLLRKASEEPLFIEEKAE